MFGSKKDPSYREIVYEFAEIRGQLLNPILDTVLLRRPKDEIYMAFDFYIGSLHAMAVHSRDAEEELEQVKVLRMSIADFQDIDPADKAIVSEINTGRRFERFRSARTPDQINEVSSQFPDDFMILATMKEKYSKRSFDECRMRW